MAIPADYICHGSDHGTQYAGEFGGFYSARATALACPLSDRRWTTVRPVSQRIERRPWAPEDGRCWQAIDESGRRFY